MKFSHIKTSLLLLLIPITLITGCSTDNSSPTTNADFNKKRAYNDIKHQISLGSRAPGTEGHEQIQNWILGELEPGGWHTSVQDIIYNNKPIRNIIGTYGDGYPWVIIGAHYDTRYFADEDTVPENRQTPVPGANDGGSGVSVLLELSRTIPELPENSTWPKRITIVFFDAEDNGYISDWDWAMGSQAFVQELEDFPDAVVIIDMIGDEDLNICYEGNSDQHLLESLWNQGISLGYGDYFDATRICNMRDDHSAFIQAGIPTALLIDFDYPYWHTTEDTLDKISENSLEIIGDTLIQWLLMEYVEK